MDNGEPLLMMLRRLKRWVLISRLPPLPGPAYLRQLLLLGRWLRAHPPPVHFATREALYDWLASRWDPQPFDYLEAGVYRGASLRYWVRLSSHPATRFFGFDTFTGLPAPWRTGWRTFPAGSFDAGGRPPEIPDPRVQWIVGRFEQTLPLFLRDWRPAARVLVHCDADLYDSTRFFLASLEPSLPEGTILLFDNFSVATHDFRAFCDVQEACGRSFEVLAAAEVDFEKMAIRLGPRAEPARRPQASC